MFSVNIDKIVGMTDNEKKCYEELRENLKKELNGGKVLAITKNGIGARSEERRVGKECRSRWSPYH